MNRLVVSSLLGGALLLSGAAGASPNLVADPGFESGGFSGWTVVGNLGSDVGVDQVFLDVNSGSFGAYLGNADTSTLSQDVATVAGAQYEVSFYLDVYQSTAYDGFFTVSFGGQSVASLVEPAVKGTTARITLSLGQASAKAVRENAGAASAAEANDRKRRRSVLVMGVLGRPRNFVDVHGSCAGACLGRG